MCGVDFDGAAFDERITDDVVAFGSAAKDGHEMTPRIAAVEVVPVGFLFCAPRSPRIVCAEDHGHTLLERVVDVGQGFDRIACDGKLDALGSVGGEAVFERRKAHRVGGGGVASVHRIAHRVNGAVSRFGRGLLCEAECIESHKRRSRAAIAVAVRDIAASSRIVVGCWPPLCKKRLVGLLGRRRKGFIDRRRGGRKTGALDQTLFEGLCGRGIVNARHWEVVGALKAPNAAFRARSKVSWAAVHIGLAEIARIHKALLQIPHVFAL